MLSVRNLRAGYGSVEVLHGVSLHVDTGEIVTIVGANGAGKSTLLWSLAGLVAPRGGAAVFEAKEITALPAEAVASRGCVLVPEGRQVFADLTVGENLLLGGYLRLRRGARRALQQDMARISDLFPILASRAHQRAGTLSGGEQQMLAVGRALMARPALLMLDEPSIGLAPLVVREIFDVIVRLRSEGTTILLVEQNARAALSISDRGYVMETGRIMLEGTAGELSANHDVRRSYLGREYRRIDE
ncbi:MAG TPA: ABC transporter ATP-binding protein [Spirochaetia bacterium]|nr:ABC transporter ATP-binding protein [Spirochaetia bacterium]